MEDRTSPLPMSRLGRARLWCSRRPRPKLPQTDIVLYHGLVYWFSLEAVPTCMTHPGGFDATCAALTRDSAAIRSDVVASGRAV